MDIDAARRQIDGTRTRARLQRRFDRPHDGVVVDRSNGPVRRHGHQAAAPVIGAGANFDMRMNEWQDTSIACTNSNHKVAQAEATGSENTQMPRKQSGPVAPSGTR